MSSLNIEAQELSGAHIGKRITVTTPTDAAITDTLIEVRHLSKEKADSRDEATSVWVTFHEVGPRNRLDYAFDGSGFFLSPSSLVTVTL